MTGDQSLIYSFQNQCIIQEENIIYIGKCLELLVDYLRRFLIIIMIQHQ